MHFFHSFWKNLHLTENFYTDMSVVSVTNVKYGEVKIDNTSCSHITSWQSQSLGNRSPKAVNMTSYQCAISNEFSNDSLWKMHHTGNICSGQLQDTLDTGLKLSWLLRDSTLSFSIFFSGNCLLE